MDTNEFCDYCGGEIGPEDDIKVVHDSGACELASCVPNDPFILCSEECVRELKLALAS